MSWQASGFVKSITTSETGFAITRGEKLVLLLLADYTNPENGIAWPSIDTLAEEGLYERRQILRIIDSLEEKGFIEVEHSEGRKTNKYRIIGIVTKCHRLKKTNSDIPPIPNSDILEPNGDIAMSPKPTNHKEEEPPKPPLEKQSPSAQERKTETKTEPIQLDVYSAALGLSEKMGVGNRGKIVNNLINAITQAERRWPGKDRFQIVDDIVALWKEYLAQGLHAPVAVHNWLDTIGTFIDSDHWKKKPKEPEAPKYSSGFKPATPTPAWAFRSKPE